MSPHIILILKMVDLICDVFFNISEVCYARQVFYLKNVEKTGSIGCYMYMSTQPLKLGSNFHEIYLARQVSTARSHA